MEKQKQEYFRKVLQTWLNDLTNEMRQNVSHLTHDEEVYADWTDVASVETDKTVQLKIKDRERMLIIKIQSAIKRLDEGTFGDCQRCGEPIAEQRLKARPVTTLCIECKSELEGVEQRFRYSQ